MFLFLRENAPYLATGFLLTFASSFGQTYFISIFAGEIQGEFGLSHGEWGGIYAAATMASAVVMIWAGTLTDHYRVRILGPIALLCLAFATIAMAASANWIWLLVSIFALRLFGQGMLSHIGVVAMARWYVAVRGRALSIAGLGYSLGESCLPLIFVALMAFADWRSLWIVAAIILIALIPVIRRLLRVERTPQSSADRDEAVGMGGRHWSRVEALRHWLFWMLVPAIAGASAFLTALFFQQVHLAEVKGWEHARLVAIFPLYTLCGIGSMLLSGWALDKFGTAALIPFSQLPISAGFAVIWATDGFLGAVLGFVLVGLSHGAYSTLFNAFWAEFYGTKHLGGIKSLAAAFMVFGSAVGPGITGLSIDRGIDFPDQMLVIAGFFLIASAISCLGVQRAWLLLAVPA